MAGDPTKASLWTSADVFIAPIGTPGPSDLTSPWPTSWEVVGLLNGEEGFNWGREEETSEHYAWGGLLVKRTRSKHKRQVTFVALEDNEVVFRLINPGSDRVTDTDTGITTSTVKVPQPEEFAFGVELNEGLKRVRRFAKRAEVAEVGEIQESETAPTVYTITVVLYPEPDGTLYTELSGNIA